MTWLWELDPLSAAPISGFCPKGARRLSLVFALLGLLACRSNGGEGPGRGKPIDAELFQRILAEGTLRPVDDFDSNLMPSVTELERLELEQKIKALQDSNPSGQAPSVPGETVPEGENPSVSGVDDTQPAGEFDEGIDDGLGDLADLISAGDQATGETPISAYLEFGSQIHVYKSGLVMKPYSFPLGIGAKALELLTTYGDFPVHAAGTNGEGLPAAGAEQPLDSVVLDLRTDWSVEAWSDPRKPGLQSPTPVKLGDLLIVTAQPDVLREVEHFIRIFLEQVTQIEIEAKIVEVSTSDVFDFGIKPLDDTTPIFALPNSGGLVRSMDYSFGNTVNGTEALFNVGAVFDGVAFNALLELVSTEENVQIISRPKVVARSGGRAEIVNTTQIPFFDVRNINANGTFTTGITYKPVGVQMYVVPWVVGRDTVVLNIDIEVSAKTGTAVAFTQGGSSSSTAVVTVPEISQRRATTIVRLEPGQAVVLGGLISERTLERESKIPILGDIPILGNLFKSKFKEKQQTNVLFYIRPRVLQGGDLNAGFGD